MAASHRVVIIGSGFGGLFATRELAGVKSVEITLIDRTPQHLFQPLLYQVATGILSEGEIAPPTRSILSKQKNVRTVLGEVIDIDVEARTVTSEVLGTTAVIGYDTLIVAAGARTSYFGHDDYAADAPGLKTIEDALELRSRIFGAFELAELETDPVKRAEWLTFVVVGAGATGVEMAGQIAELAHRSLAGNFRQADLKAARIILIDGGDEPLSAFGTKLAARAAKQLGKLGVELWLGTMVDDVDATSIDVVDRAGKHTTIRARTKVWSAGVTAAPLAKVLADRVGLKQIKGGRIPVQRDLTIAGHKDIFVIGDMAGLDDLPGVSPVAIQGGKFVADQIKRRLLGKESGQAFKYFDKGSMATVSRFNAVASIKGIQLDGFVAWVLWLVVHLFYLVGFKNRVTTVFHWLVSFIGSSRSERTGSVPMIPSGRSDDLAVRADLKPAEPPATAAS
jgi:NADH:ubiquinone reductase (H+-translocating)